MNFLSPGEKIKKIRKDLKISQEKLIKDIMSKPMLSYIENNKVPLNKKNAIKLCERLSELSSYKTNIDYKDVLLSTEEQASKCVSNVIKNRNDYTVEEFLIIKRNIDKYASSYNRIKFNAYIGSFLYNKYSNLELCIFFLESLLLDINRLENPFKEMTILQLQRSYGKLNKPKLIIELSKKINNNSLKNSEIKGIIHFNTGLAMQLEGNYNEGINMYENAMSLLKKTLHIEICINNIGNCYILNNEITKAIDFYMLNLKKNHSNFNKLLCYSNLIICGVKSDNKSLIENMILKLEEVIPKVPVNKRYQSYMCIADGYFHLENNRRAQVFYEKELELEINIKDSHFLIEKYIYCIIQLLNLYDFSNVKKLKLLEIYIEKVSLESFSKKDILTILEICLSKFGKSYSLNIVSKLMT